LISDSANQLAQKINDRQGNIRDLEDEIVSIQEVLNAQRASA